MAWTALVTILFYLATASPLTTALASSTSSSPAAFKTYSEFRRHFGLPRLGLYGRGRGGFGASPSREAFHNPHSLSPPKYATRWHNATLDHFNFANTLTFPLRYLINEEHFAGPGSPIFLYTGNEGDIEWFARNTGFVWEIAPEFGATVLFVEHRYYGLSLPFGKLSYADPKRLGFLTSEQVRLAV